MNIPLSDLGNERLIELLAALDNAYNLTIGSGKTHAMLYGIAGSDRDIFLISNSKQGAEHCLRTALGDKYNPARHVGVGIFERNIMSNIKGRNVVIIVEPYITHMLVRELLDRMKKEL